jgi:hypothetical protein
MADETKQGLSTEELESQTGEALPDREAMSVVWIEPEGPPVDPVDPPIQSEKGPEPLGGGEQL